MFKDIESLGIPEQQQLIRFGKSESCFYKGQQRGVQNIKWFDESG